MSLHVRTERPHDHDAIRALVELAFRTAPHADGDEHVYVDRLRAGAGYLPELALVAEESDALVGHIMLTAMAAISKNGLLPLLLLSPVSVSPGHQHQGIGSTLIREALAHARAAGHQAVVLVGDPAFYQRFGFRTSTDFGISNLDGFPAHNVMALELVAGALAHVAEATVSFPK